MLRKLVFLLFAGPLALAAKPNLLLITADDLNCDSVGAFGCKLEGITPHLDRLAAQGLCLDRGFVTASICQPSRAVWMTGRYPHRPFAGSDQETWRPRPATRRTFQPHEVTVPKFLPDLPEVRREMAEYFTSVHRADEVVGAILAELEQAGLTGETLVMFMSDNGMPLPFAKSNCYWHSNRTPWIVRWPGEVKAATRDREHFVSGIDVAPTLLDAAGLPTLAGADGRSLKPLFKGERQQDRKRVFTMVERIWAGKEYPMRAVVEEDFLYIWNGWADGKTRFQNESQSGRSMKAMREAAKNDPDLARRVDHFVHRCREEMYDLKNDPDCLHNLIAKPNDAWSPRASAMTKSLWHWMKETGDPQRGSFEAQVELALD
jgi:N-sulfoglucosamine sulfohydrolase